MKHLLIILCVCVLCFKSTSGSYSSPLRKTKTPSVGAHSGMYKRQNSPDSDQTNELCSRVLLTTACTNDEIQELANFYQQCNFSSNVQGIENVCAYNSMGKYCGEFDTEDVLSTCDLFASNCSSKCRNVLIRSRYQLGCCANITYDLLGPLWSRCGVDIEAKKCDSTVTLNPARADSTCSEDELLAGTLSIFCRRHYVEDIQDKLSATKDCQDFKLDNLYMSCKINRNGEYCATLTDQMWTIYSGASLSCTDNSTCEPRCMEALTNITNTVGCCLNEEYNASNTAFVDWWLGNKYWSMCNLASLGSCELKLTNGPGNQIALGLTSGEIAGIAIAAATVLAVLMVAIVMAVICVVRVAAKRRLAQYVCIEGEELLEATGTLTDSTLHAEHELEGESDKDGNASDLIEDKY